MGSCLLTLDIMAILQHAKVQEGAVNFVSILSSTVFLPSEGELHRKLGSHFFSQGTRNENRSFNSSSTLVGFIDTN